MIQATHLETSRCFFMDSGVIHDYTFTTMNTKQCVHCYPIPTHTWHLLARIDALLSPISTTFLIQNSWIAQKFPRFFRAYPHTLLYGLFRILLFVRIFKETEVHDIHSSVSDRSKVFIEAVHKKDLHINAINFRNGNSSEFFSMNIRGQKIIYTSLGTADIAYHSPISYDDKWIFKNFLKQNNFPYAQGNVFRSTSRALQFGKQLGFPLVVKPRNSSLSRHVTCNIQNDAELKEAIRIAKIISNECIVEQHIEGNVYRITVVNQTYSASCQREKPSIVGNGINTIRELSAIKNIGVFTSFTEKILSQQGYKVSDILEQGKKIYLHDKMILACGADIYDTTDIIHTTTKDLFLAIAHSMNVPLIGFDCVARDISADYTTQTFAILEANSIPNIEMHHAPTTGTPRDVAGDIVNYLMNTNQ